MKNDDVSEGSRELVDLSAEAHTRDLHFMLVGSLHVMFHLPLSPHLMRLVCLVLMTSLHAQYIPV